MHKSITVLPWTRVTPNLHMSDQPSSWGIFEWPGTEGIEHTSTDRLFSSKQSTHLRTRWLTGESAPLTCGLCRSVLQLATASQVRWGSGACRRRRIELFLLRSAARIRIATGLGNRQSTSSVGVTSRRA